MAIARAAVLCGFGINCEDETAHALRIAGAKTELVHFNSLQKSPQELQTYQLLALPGGFSFGDDIQSGRVLANKFKFKIFSSLKKFVDEGKPVIGICNGFQALVQLGALPGWDGWEARNLTLMANRNGKFEDRWVRLRTESCACPFAQGMDAVFSLPIRHGEGQVALSDLHTLEKLSDNRQIVFRYAGKDGMKATSYPDNPNGSADAIAGLCNQYGNVLGMMPHPECHVRYLQNPLWTANPPQIGERKEEDALSGILKKIGLHEGEKLPGDYGNCIPFFQGVVNAAKRH
ncbi:phosphoribosylformylglycinamidine synthase I [Candidatus Micrarchaeota archaeon CG10_big_fil_rev_8_21_14_0_10_45_29]|nr:MAG: phosphoribosylformylglycinamidine synthase I [Candidatus Micrarchaeota archaeon CG10_big_fil_rev_8_21_14_0_10_45_29]